MIAASRVAANMQLRFRVAQALVQGHIRDCHYQRVVSAADLARPAFFEMLARLRLPNGPLLPAGAFMPAIEAGPLGRAIDRLALAKALKALAADPGLRLSVNMSPLSMGDEGWLALIAAAHRGGSGICGRLIIEITENAAVADAGQTIDFMNHVRATGCAFALDDFGASSPASATSATSASTSSRSTARSCTGCMPRATPRCWFNALPPSRGISRC